jgi:hypothetical protein
MSDKKHSHHITETPDTSHIKNLDVTHETSDVNVGSIGKFVLGLLVLTIVTHIALWGMFRMLEAEEVKKERPRPPLAQSGLPQEPRLQSAPGFAEGLEKTQPKHEGEPQAPAEADPNRPKDALWEIKALNAQWHDTLEHGPVDQSGKRYGMPIEKAKEEVLKQLPVRKQ